MNTYTSCFQDSTIFEKIYFKKLLWIAASIKSSPGLPYARSTFHCAIIILIFNDKHFPGSNKGYYPISGRNNFTVLLTYLVGWQDFINEEYPPYYICFPLKKFFQKQSTKRLQHRCFPLNIAKLLRTPILLNIYKWLLFNITWKKLLEVLNIDSKNYCSQTFMIKTVFYNSTYLVINKNTSF